MRGLPADPAQSLYHHNENSGFRDRVCPLASKRDKLITHASSSSRMQGPPAHPAQSLGVIIMTYGGFHSSVFPLASTRFHHDIIGNLNGHIRLLASSIPLLASSMTNISHAVGPIHGPCQLNWICCHQNINSSLNGCVPFSSLQSVTSFCRTCGAHPRTPPYRLEFSSG